ncbi:MAG: mycothiol synthase [Egibacteraceae bacterium]
MHVIELRTHLNRPILDEILELIEAATRIEGHRPVGEHKYSHLRVGARNWVGIMAYEQQKLVGYAHTRWNAAGDMPRMAVEVVVHPEWYGSDVAATLLAETREVLARAGGGLLYLWVHRVEDSRGTLAARLGFEVQRELAFMSLPLSTRHADLPLPLGITVRRYRGKREDDQEFLRVNNAAFRGHPENGDWDAGEFAERRSREWFHVDDLIMAWRRERLAGFHWTKWHSHESDEMPAHDPVGEVYILAVDPTEQGTGLGRALLAAGLQHLYDRGCAEAVLYVDCASAGAVALYESEGFQTQYREVCYQDWVEPAGAQPASDLLRPA